MEILYTTVLFQFWVCPRWHLTGPPTQGPEGFSQDNNTQPIYLYCHHLKIISNSLLVFFSSSCCSPPLLKKAFRV